MDKLWTPPKVMPTVRKDEGGSYFDDEMESEQDHQRKFEEMRRELIRHINERPDHIVYVADTDQRGQMREVFNSWRHQGIIRRVPSIKIDYGVRDGTIRVDEERQ